MKKLFMLPALFALAVTGCGGDDPSPVDTQWAQELKTEMTQYLGLVLGLALLLGITSCSRSKIDNAKYQVKLAENEIDLAKQNIYFEVQNLYVNMTQMEKQIPLLAVKVKQTLENFELADGRYAVGLGDYIELQDAKRNYNTAQVNYVQTVYNYNVARANLEMAIALPQSVSVSIEDKE